jgi:hypothetical protein
MWSLFGRLLGLVVFVLGAVSGYMAAISPQCSAQAQWIPGLLVAIASLVVLMIGSTLRQIFERESILAAFGIVSAAVFFFTIPVYIGTYHAMTIVVEHETDEGVVTSREVQGDIYSPAANAARFLHGDAIGDEQLVQTMGAVSAVWTTESVLDYWRRLLLFYVVVASSLVCTVCFVGAFIDRTTAEQQEARDSASSARRFARRRAARRRRSRES